MMRDPAHLPVADVHVHNASPGDVSHRASRGHRYRTDLGWWRRQAYRKQADFAADIGWTRSYVSLLETGLVLPTREEALKIVKLLSDRLGTAIMVGVLWPTEELCQLLGARTVAPGANGAERAAQGRNRTQ